MLLRLLGELERNPEWLEKMSQAERRSPDRFGSIAIMMNYIRYSNAVDRLKELVATSEKSRTFNRS